MSSKKSIETLQSWSEINKNRKEQKRKWKEENLTKKLEKQKRKKSTEELQNKEKQEQAVKELPTISIAVPGSILETAQSPELRSYVAGQIARAACIFQIDEIVVFDDFEDDITAKKATLEDNYGQKTMRESCIQLGRILQYLECPQYLRKQFFPIHSNLKYCGILNPLNAPHHLSKDEHFQFRLVLSS